ncbi:MAG: cytochrome P450 [Candidatus Promineifilaceae bacterium]|nr:cytochrome P450 [Candidatus Promineifilaceae bacterium]
MISQSKENEISYDLFSSRFKSDPFPTYAKMRREAPIYAHRAPDGTAIWYITAYNDVVAVLRDDENFCKDPRNARSSPSGPASRKTTIHQRINENMLFSDPPHHSRLRALVSKTFTPRRIESMAPHIQLIADKLLDEVEATGHMDLIASYALPLPLAVICEMLGIPSQDHELVADWSQAIISPGSRNLNYSTRKRKVRAFIAYLDQLTAKRRTDPQDDLITDLAMVEEQGDRLSEMELSSMIALLLVTGHETTVNLIGNGALALLLHPDQTTFLREQPSYWLLAVEELLRYDGPVETSTSRWARRDVQFREHVIKSGDLVRVVLSSANRDENIWDRAQDLDVGRPDNKHLAFGMGIHYCLGAPLARLEGVIALKTLFHRFQKVKLILPPEELTWRSGILFRALEKLEVRCR